MIKIFNAKSFSSFPTWTCTEHNPTNNNGNKHTTDVQCMCIKTMYIPKYSTLVYPSLLFWPYYSCCENMSHFTHKHDFLEEKWNVINLLNVKKYPYIYIHKYKILYKYYKYSTTLLKVIGSLAFFSIHQSLCAINHGPHEMINDEVSTSCSGYIGYSWLYSMEAMQY